MNTRTSFLARFLLASGCALACVLPAGPSVLAAGAPGVAPAASAPAALPGIPSETAPGGLRSFAAGADAEAAPATGFLRELIEAGREEPEFLHPDVAFRVEASAEGADLAVIRWRIEPGYYLYAKRMEAHLPVGSPPGTSIAGLDLPQGEMQEDPYFGRVEVYRFDATASVRLAHVGSPPPDVILDVVYQGCADEGLCYPPIQKALSVRLDGGAPGLPAVGSAASASPSVLPPDEASFSETDRIAWELATEGVAASVAAFFGFGLLLSLTPCILPMVPILSSILVAGGGAARGRARGFALSLAYVAGSALAWAAIGGVAGLLGANVQIALQNPWAIGVVGAAFIVLALSMFGLYTLELPAAWMTRASGWTNRAGRGGGHAGAAAMGFVSALVVAPCVAAPMAGAVLYIGQAGDAVRGSLALAAMGFGMGVPLLALGASSERLLPRTGPWMETVQRAAGVVLLGVAAYLFERVLPPAGAMIAWALVAASAAMVLLQAGWRRRAAAAGAFAAAAYSVVLLLGAATGAHDPLDPFGGLRATVAGPEADANGLEFVSIKGLDGPDGLDAALARAEAAGRFVMLDFYADWCVSCKEMEKLTFRDPRVVAALAGVRVLRADVTANDAADQALMQRVGIFGPPAILFFGPDRVERRRYRTVGFKEAADFTKRVTGATSAA